MNNELVSVVMTVYNGEEYVRKTILSVLGQTYKHLELIIIDDGSTDETPAVLKEFFGFENVKVFFRAHSGNIGKNLNDAIKVSKGNIIAILGADDLWFENKIKVQLQYLLSEKIVCSNGNVINIDDMVINDKVNNYKEDIYMDLDALLKDNRILASSVVSHKNILYEAGLFDEVVGNRSEDYFLWINIALKYKIRFINQILMSYRIHGRNLTIRSFFDKKELYERNIEIISPFTNHNVKSIVESANYGISLNYIRLIKLYYNNQDLVNSFLYCKKFLLIYNKKFSFRYLRAILFFMYLFFLRIIK